MASNCGKVAMKTLGDEQLCIDHYTWRTQLQDTGQFLAFAEMQREESPSAAEPYYGYYDDDGVPNPFLIHCSLCGKIHDENEGCDPADVGPEDLEQVDDYTGM